MILLENRINYDWVLQALYPNKYFNDDCDYFVNNYWSALIRDFYGHMLEINDIKFIHKGTLDNRKVWILYLSTGNWIGVFDRER